MIYSPHQIKTILDTNTDAKDVLHQLLKNWSFKSKDLEYTKKKELQKYIATIESYIESNERYIAMLTSLLYDERDSCKRLRLKNEKFKRFIKNQGFNPNDFEWINLSEI
jgi:hypothetical protein